MKNLYLIKNKHNKTMGVYWGYKNQFYNIPNNSFNLKHNLHKFINVSNIYSKLINVDFQIWLFKPIHIKNSLPIITISENNNFILDLNNINKLNLIYHLKYNKFELI